MTFRTVAIQSAKEAGEILLRASRKKTTHRLKSRHDIQIPADIQSEKSIIRAIRKNFPTHSILAEESGEQLRDSEYLWVIDPLDATINFSRGIEEYCVSIALTHRGQPIIGVVYQPALKKLFVAERGKGALLNGKRIFVSRQKDPITMLIATDNSADPQTRRRNLATMSRIGLDVRHVRVFGSAALHLARLAAGSLDVYYRTTFHYWDVAAGVLLVQEAGGRVTDFFGKPFSRESEGVIATNGMAHTQIVSKLRNACESSYDSRV